jgi:hypothetical protein
MKSFHVLLEGILFGGRRDSFRVPEGDVLPVLKAHYK